MLASIPSIPIHISEIKKLILKEQGQEAGVENNKGKNNEDSALDGDNLLTVLTNGSTGRNPTFFKALGHQDVFGLRADLPKGATTVEMTEAVASEDGTSGVDGSESSRENVLYVKLPEGHPVITQASSAEASPKGAVSPEEEEKQEERVKEKSDDEAVNSDLKPSLSFEEAIEQAELVFEDDVNLTLGVEKEQEAKSDVSSAQTGSDSNVDKDSLSSGEQSGKRNKPSVCEPIAVVVDNEEPAPSTSSTRSSRLASPAKRVSPRISPRIQSRQQQQQLLLQQQQEAAALAKAAAASKAASSDEVDGPRSKQPHSSSSPAPSSSSHSSPAAPSSPAEGPASTVGGRHNLRPKRSLRHVVALKQQAKRRKRNTSVAAGTRSPSQRTLSGGGAARRSSITSNGDIEIHYRPTARDVQFLSGPSGGRHQLTMKDVVSSIPGFPPLAKLKPSNSSVSKKSGKKLSAAAALQQVREKTVDMESPDSILAQVNLRTLLNKGTFLRLPPSYQYKLMQLLPQVDNISDDSNCKTSR